MQPAPEDVVLFAGLAVAAVLDWRTGRIPNVLTFPMMAVGIAVHASYGTAPTAVAGAVVGIVGVGVAFAMFFALFALGVVRGGDAKLMMGVGACLGWEGVLETGAWLALLYVPVGLLALALQGKLSNLAAVARHRLAIAQGADPGPAPEATVLRTGPVIAAAGVFAWATGWLDFVR